MLQSPPIVGFGYFLLLKLSVLQATVWRLLTTGIPQKNDFNPTELSTE